MITGNIIEQETDTGISLEQMLNLTLEECEELSSRAEIEQIAKNLPGELPKSPEDIRLDYYLTQRMAFLALAYIPQGSYYRDWCCRHIADGLEARKYPKLRSRLIRFHSQGELAGKGAM